VIYTKVKDKILKYVLSLKSEHFSYCKFPEEECSCQKIEIDYDTPLKDWLDSFEIEELIVFLETMDIYADRITTINDII